MTATPFDILCPQHLCFDNDGVITHVGPGISTAADQPLFNLLTILRPLGISDLADAICPRGSRALKSKDKMIAPARCGCAALGWRRAKPILWHCPAKRDQTIA
jgi:hypothetical protein